MKTTCLFALLALAGTLTAAEKLPVLNYTFTLKPLKESNTAGAFEDPGFRKLTDGRLKVEGGKVFFRYRDNREKQWPIHFNFKTEVKLSEAKIHYYREKNSFGIKDIRLVGIQSDGKRIPLGSVTLNQPYRRPDSDPPYMCAVVKSEDDTPVKSIDVIFTRTGGYLALTEIEFFGEAVKNSKAAESTTP